MSRNFKLIYFRQIVHAFENPTFTSRDRALRKRTVFMLINALAAITLMIITVIFSDQNDY